MSYQYKVWTKPSLINNLSHGLTFASNADINERLVTRYRNYSYLTLSDTANVEILKSVINEWSDYANKLYATTIYEYDPLLNYDMREEGSIIDELHKGHKRSFAAQYTDSVNVDRKTSTAEDRKTASAVDRKIATAIDTTEAVATDQKVATATDTKIAVATDQKVATATDQKVATATNLNETETPRVKVEEMHTGYGLGSDASGSPVELITTEPKTGTNSKLTSGAANANYSETTGSALNNYTETTGTAADNYQQTTGTAANNYTQTTGTAANNYKETTADASENYTQETASENANYDRVTAAAADNYEREVAVAADNYTQHSASPANNYETETDIDANTYDHNVRTFDDYRKYVLLRNET